MTMVNDQTVMRIFEKNSDWRHKDIAQRPIISPAQDPNC